MKFANLQEAFSHIESFTNLEKTQQYTVRTYRLDRMFRLLEHFGRPDHSFKSVHVAGSKGKGSTCTLLAYALKELGLTVGLYGSPHVSTYLERFTLAGAFFPESMMLETIHELFDRLQGFSFPEERGYDHPTTFELLTMLAFLLFKKAGCEYAVLETGLGGRLDATNVVSPVLTAITPIELEHTDILGSTIAEIAEEKSGILKEGVPVVIAPQHLEAKRVIQNIADQRNCPQVYLPDILIHCSSHSTLTSNRLKLLWADDTLDELELKMLGSFQGENCAAALVLAEKLGVIRSAEDRRKVIQGTSKAVLPGRMEVIRREPMVVIDGAHTRRSIERVIISYRELFPEGGTIIFGAVSGKDHTHMVEEVLKHFSRVVISTPGTFKPSSPLELYKLFTSTAQVMVTEGELDSPPIILFEPDPIRAVERADQLSFPEEGILVTGSFYMAAEIRDCFVRG